MPDEWAAAVRRWSALNADHRVEVDRARAPDANEEYLIYQTLIGAWPPGAGDPGAEFTERISAYMAKALHEAKVHTSLRSIPNAGLMTRPCGSSESARSSIRGRGGRS